MLCQAEWLEDKSTQLPQVAVHCNRRLFQLLLKLFYYYCCLLLLQLLPPQIQLCADIGGSANFRVIIHYVAKKVHTFKLSVTLSNINRFSTFLHCWKAYENCYKIYDR